MTTDHRPSIEELTDNFDMLGDWESRFSYLLDLGKKLPEMDVTDQSEANRVHGCQSTVYLKPSVSDDTPPKVSFIATSDAHIVRGLIAILQSLYCDRTPKQILNTDAKAVFANLGLDDHLSPTRRNGLYAMVQRVRTLAEAYDTP